MAENIQNIWFVGSAFVLLVCLREMVKNDLDEISYTALFICVVSWPIVPLLAWYLIYVHGDETP